MSKTMFASRQVLAASKTEAANDVLPSFGHGGRPKPEGRADLARIHVFATTAVVIGIAYLVWRWIFTIDLDY